MSLTVNSRVNVAHRNNEILLGVTVEARDALLFSSRERDRGVLCCNSFEIVAACVPDNSAISVDFDGAIGSMAEVLAKVSCTCAGLA